MNDQKEYDQLKKEFNELYEKLKASFEAIERALRKWSYPC